MTEDFYVLMEIPSQRANGSQTQDALKITGTHMLASKHAESLRLDGARQPGEGLSRAELDQGGKSNSVLQ